MSEANWFTVGAAAMAAIPGIIAAFQAHASKMEAQKSRKEAEKIKRRMKIQQERIEERDLIGKEKGFLIPVGNNDLWNDYFNFVTTEKMTRGDAANKLMKKVSKYPDPLIKERID